jgi:hypothetical protein
MTYRALYSGDGPDTSPLLAVARVDGDRVDVIFVDDELFEDMTAYWSIVFNLAIADDPAQWDEYKECNEYLWKSLWQGLKEYNDRMK